MTLSSVNSIEKTLCPGSYSYRDTQHMKYYTPLCYVNAKFRNRVWCTHKSCWGNNIRVLDSCLLPLCLLVYLSLSPGEIFCKRYRFTHTETHILRGRTLCCCILCCRQSKMEKQAEDVGVVRRCYEEIRFLWENVAFALCRCQYTLSVTYHAASATVLYILVKMCKASRKQTFSKFPNKHTIISDKQFGFREGL